MEARHFTQVVFASLLHGENKAMRYREILDQLDFAGDRAEEREREMRGDMVVVVLVLPSCRRGG